MALHGRVVGVGSPLMRMGGIASFAGALSGAGCLLLAFGAGLSIAHASTGHGVKVTRFQLDAAPVALTVADGSVWVVEETSGMRAMLVRIDPRTGRRRSQFLIGGTGPDFGAVSSSGSIIWAAAGNHVLRVDASRRDEVRRVAVPGEAAAVAVSRGSVWLGTIGRSHNWIIRLDSSTLATRRRISLTVQPVALQTGLSSLWLATPSGLWRIDEATGQVLPNSTAISLPIGLGSTPTRLWVTEEDDHVSALDEKGRVRDRFALAFSPDAVAVTPGRVWVTTNCGCRTGRVVLIDARTGQQIANRPIGETPVALAPDKNGVWVATFGDGTVTHVEPN